MRLEIGAGAAAGRAGGVLWSSAILAAISPRGAAFTSPLPAPARSAEPAASARLRPHGLAACGPAARAARSSSAPGPFLYCVLRSSGQGAHPSVHLYFLPARCIQCGLLLAQAISTSLWVTSLPSLRFSLPQFSCLKPPVPFALSPSFPFPLEACLLAPEGEVGGSGNECVIGMWRLL